MSLRYPLLLTSLFALLLLVGCDAATEDPTDGLDGATEAEVTAEAAASIANAIALDSGGALDEAATFATTFGASVGTSEVPIAEASTGLGCALDIGFDEETVRYDRVVDCAWESENGLYAASYSRSQTVQFLRDGSPVVFPANADAATFEIVSGSGTRERPRFSHTLTDIGGSLGVEGLDTAFVTVNGSQTRAALDVWTTEAGTRSLDHRIELVYTDLVGPKSDRRAWQDNVSGTISGRYQATLTTVDGETIAVDRTFTVTFEGGTAVIVIDGIRFEADPLSGELT